ncbi:MAG: hypothetical protein ABL986_23775 [Vicinamibacterales bacterium]
MLFEVAVALAEQALRSQEAPDWDAALNLAVRRQKRHFDVLVPAAVEDADRAAASQVASNLVLMLRAECAEDSAVPLVVGPEVPGFEWIASSSGDFSVGRTLIEVKCTRGNFSAADYRQVLLYWLLSFASSVEKRTHEWSRIVLMNPRRCTSVAMTSDELVHLLAAGRSKVEVLELFAAMISDGRG